MVQERIDKFKQTFDTLMTKSMVSLGHFNKDHNKISEGDVVLILDKKKNTLGQTFCDLHTLLHTFLDFLVNITK